jgi:hypothetical protein
MQETLNQFVFNFGSLSSQLSRIISFDLLGIPQDQLFRWALLYVLLLQCTALCCWVCGLMLSWQSKYWQLMQVYAARRSEADIYSRGARRYKSGIERVQPQDVLAAAQRRLHPGQQTIVVAGDAKMLRKELSKLGMPIQELKLPKSAA